jgi:hypothetical protein
MEAGTLGIRMTAVTEYVNVFVAGLVLFSVLQIVSLVLDERRRG